MGDASWIVGPMVVVGAQEPEGGDSFHTFSVCVEGCLLKSSSLVLKTFSLRLFSEQHQDSALR